MKIRARLALLATVIVLAAVPAPDAAAAKPSRGDTPQGTTQRPVNDSLADPVRKLLADTLGERRTTLAYWTPRRMRAALPATAPTRRKGNLGALLPPRKPAKPRSDNPRPSQARQWGNQGTVRGTAGKVFFTLGRSDYVCSGTVVSAGNRDTVVTAGHCVNEGPGKFATNWVFVPGYERGNAPHGTWAARALYASRAWVERGDLDSDVGFAVLGNQNGRHVADTVGAQNIDFETRRGADVYAFGYPQTYPYDGERLYYCRGKQRPDPYGGRDQGVDCDMTEGSSGGPWLAGFDPATGRGTVVSVNSFGYDNMPNVMWGPSFDNETREVYEAAARA